MQGKQKQWSLWENLTFDKQLVLAPKSFLSNTLRKTNIRLDRTVIPLAFFCSRVLVFLWLSKQVKYSRTSELRNPLETRVFVSLKFPKLWNHQLTSRFDAVLYIFHEECAAVITMEHKLAEAKALCYRAKIDDPFPFYRNFDDTYQICILYQCLVDWVFCNCGVRNSEVLLYWFERFLDLMLQLNSCASNFLIKQCGFTIFWPTG